MQTRYSADIVRYKAMSSAELRETFVVSDLFAPDAVPLTYSDIDRGIVGSAVPVSGPLTLPAPKSLASETLLARREMGVINIGGPGTVTLDGEAHRLGNLASLYIGRGTNDVVFDSDDAGGPAKFYLVSYPAHRDCPSKLVEQSEANRIDLGNDAKANKRTIFQSLRPGIVDSCQLVMGFTMLAEGNVWNTFPPHTHARRSEFYMYFGLGEDERVFHMMGAQSDIRPLVMRNEEAALSPLWSMHCGAGTSAYGFVWSMGGENQEFDDMDHLAIGDLG